MPAAVGRRRAVGARALDRYAPTARSTAGRASERGIRRAARCGVRELCRRHPIVCFLVITFAVTWSEWFWLAANDEVVTSAFSPVYLVGLVGPLIGAVATTAITHGRAGLRELGGRMVRVRVAGRWWAVAIALPLAIAAATYLVLVVYSMFLLAPVALPTAAGFAHFSGMPAIHAVVTALLLIAINGYGEETGWRGFLLPAIEQRGRGRFVASLTVAVVWALWHAPAFVINENYRALPATSLPMFFIGLAAGSLLLTWLYHRGRNSIAVVAVWHGIFNLTSGTLAARGALAMVETTAVFVIAAYLVVSELVASYRGRPGRHVLRPLPTAR